MKPNLLLLHGALGSKAQFADLKEQLSDHFIIHLFDFEGHGQNASSNDFSIDLFTQNTFDFLTKNQIQKTNIFGYSMGGYVGLNLAKNQPESVQKIMTLATKFDWTPETAANEIRKLNPEKIAEKVPAFADKLASVHSKNDWKEVVRKTAKMMQDLGTGKRITKEELAQITTEIKVGIGSLDKMVSVDESKESAEILPNGSLEIIEGFKHPIDLVDTKNLAALILDFLKK